MQTDVGFVLAPCFLTRETLAEDLTAAPRRSGPFQQRECEPQHIFCVNDLRCGDAQIQAAPPELTHALSATYLTTENTQIPKNAGDFAVTASGRAGTTTQELPVLSSGKYSKSRRGWRRATNKARSLSQVRYSELK